MTELIVKNRLNLNVSHLKYDYLKEVKINCVDVYFWGRGGRFKYAQVISQKSLFFIKQVDSFLIY